MQNFIYDITVIIPVYNSEEYLEKSIKSIISQTHPFSKIEIILINDGSEDNSINICKSFSDKYENILLIDKNNAGVSAARNDGMDNARGKYIILLDSDDFLSKKSLHNLFSFFEKHYDEIDLLTYPLYTYKGGKKKLHGRYLYYDKGTNIYDLNEYPHINQATINIMLKNSDTLPRYDTTMALAEDQKFNIMCLANKKKIGFCKSAAYYYRKHGAGISDTKNNPLYCYENIMKYNEFLANTMVENGVCYKYVQSYILSTISWRLKSDQLFPNHIEESDANVSIERLKNILQKVEVSTICDFPHFNNNVKTYLLSLKGCNIDYNFNDKNYSVTCGDIVVEEGQSIPTTIHRFNYLNNKLNVLGFFNTTLFENKKPKLFIKITYLTSSSSTFEVPLRDSTRSLINDNLKLGNIYAFDISLDIKNVKSIELYVEVDNLKYSLDYLFQKKRNNLCYGSKRTFILLNSGIYIRTDNIFTRIYNILTHSHYNPFVIIYKGLNAIYINHNTVWLYSDSKGVIDNAYYQFKHDIKIKDGIKRYYVLQDKLSFFDDKFNTEEKKHLIKYKSLKHKMLFFHSTKLLSSFSNATTYSPFGKSTLKYEDIIKHELIYLQHGILHASLLRMYSKDFSYIDKIVVSSQFEITSLIENYGYSKQDLLDVGMPRFAETISISVPENKIIYAPSWRKYLIGDLVNNSRKEFDDRFLKSTFYLELNKLINDKELNNVLKQNNLTLDIKLHPIFKCYQRLFKIVSKNIELNFDKIKLDNYKIFITDFSSFQFDFVRMQRPIIYFLPDHVEFKAGLHTYRNLDLKYDKAFGKLCLNKNELIDEIKQVINNNYISAQPYKERMENFFIDNITESQNNLYHKLIE